MKKEYPLLEVVQPIGVFFVSVIEAEILIDITEVKHRGQYPDAVQRELSRDRVQKIAKYCSDPDATFPTSIVVSLSLEGGYEIDLEKKTIEIDLDSKIGEIIDGQHRINGLKESGLASKFSLPVVFMVDLDSYQKAYVFSVINSKQVSVPSSLIYDLFALSKNRSPFKTCHEITRALNRSENSPFYNRLKMLGKKKEDQNLATISQGSFVKYLLELISRDPEQDTLDIKNERNLEKDVRCSLRDLFINERDDVILKIIINLFTAVKEVFAEEWITPSKSIISKPIGVGAILKFANFKVIPKGLKSNNLTEDFFKHEFKQIFEKIKDVFESEHHTISSENYGSNEQARTKLVNKMIEAYEKENPS